MLTLEIGLCKILFFFNYHYCIDWWWYMSLYLVSSVQKFFFVWKNPKHDWHNRIPGCSLYRNDDFFFSSFFQQLNSHIQTPHPLGMSQKTKEEHLKKNPKICFPSSGWAAMIERTVYDYSEQHPPFIHLFRIRHCCIKKGHGQHTSLGVWRGGRMKGDVFFSSNSHTVCMCKSMCLCS